MWNKRKGLDKFISLSKVLQDDEVIILIGISDEQQKYLPENLIGIPAVNNQTVLAKWYSVADVYINFSIEETFGLVVGEAMACGTPAIVMNSTACPEVLDANTGFVVEPWDIAAVQDAIREIRTKEKKPIFRNAKFVFVNYLILKRCRKDILNCTKR